MLGPSRSVEGGYGSPRYSHCALAGTGAGLVCAKVNVTTCATILLGPPVASRSLLPQLPLTLRFSFINIAEEKLGHTRVVPGFRRPGPRCTGGS
jgi:hypothetical protein